MDPLRLHTLTRWVGMGGPAGECLTWYVLSTTGGVGVVAEATAALLLDDGNG